jgi:hypothetical protein
LLLTMGRNEVNFVFLNTQFQPVQIDYFFAIGCLALMIQHRL